MTTISFLDRMTLPEKIRLRRPDFEHQWREYPQTSYGQTKEHCKQSQVVISNKVLIDEEVLSACPTIEHIAVAATGVNNIDLAACQKRGISVSNIPSYASTSVAEHVISMALTLRRQLLQYRQQVIKGEWQKSPHFCLFDKPIHDLQGATFGVIGFGELGQATAKLAYALNMRVIYTSPSIKQSSIARQVSLDQLLQSADIISCHCPLTDKTQNLIDESEFSLMQAHAIVINTARGGVINEQALVNALNNRQIGGAGIDVLTEEPPKPNSVLLAIANRSNVIITPHMAWGSMQAIQTLADQLIDNIESYYRGNPLNLVTPTING